MKDVNIEEVFGDQRTPGFNEVAIMVAAPENVRNWSKGEVKNPVTIYYRTL